MKTHKQAALAMAVALSLLAAQAIAQEEKKAEPKAKVAAKAQPKTAPAAKRAAEPEKKEEAPASQPASAPASQPISKVTPTKDVPKDVNPDDAMSLLKGIIGAAKGGQWSLLVGLLLMLLTWIVDRILKSKIPPKVLPWLSIGLGVAAQIALTLAAGDIKSLDTWLSAICGGAALGLTGAGGYSALGKYVGLKKKKSEAAKPAEGAS